MVKVDVRRDLDECWELAQISADNLLRAPPEECLRCIAAMITLQSCQMAELLALMGAHLKQEVHSPVQVVYDGEGLTRVKDPYVDVDTAVELELAGVN